MGPSNEFDHYPYLGCLDEFTMMATLPLNLKLDHEALIKNNVLVISAEESKTMQNPSSSYSSSSNSCSSSSSKPAMNDDEMRNTFFPPAEMRSSFAFEEEDFLQNPAPLMTKIDREYLNWQQQEMVALQLATRSDNFQGFGENKAMGLENLEEAVSVTTPQVGEKSADLHVESEEKHGFSDDRMTKSVERRQKRMIKNRESAARSRARKQAYIEYLQNKVSQLRISNNLLRKRKEEVKSILNSKSISAPIYQLRRTSSSHI